MNWVEEGKKQEQTVALEGGYMYINGIIDVYKHM